MTLCIVTTRSVPAPRTASGRPIRATLIRAMERQFRSDDRALRLIEGLKDDVSKVEEKQALTSSTPPLRIAVARKKDTDDE